MTVDLKALEAAWSACLLATARGGAISRKSFTAGVEAYLAALPSTAGEPVAWRYKQNADVDYWRATTIYPEGRLDIQPLYTLSALPPPPVAPQGRGEAERNETGGGVAKLDGNEIWEWLFGELRGDVPEALTDDLLARLAAHINCVFIAIPAIGEAALKAPRS